MKNAERVGGLIATGCLVLGIDAVTRAVNVKLPLSTKERILGAALGGVGLGMAYTISDTLNKTSEEKSTTSPK